MIPLSEQSLSIYLHVPFCTTKCTYCAFNTYTNIEQLIPAFVEALEQEIQIVSRKNPYNTVGTVFFGGGTPSLLTPAQFAVLMNSLHTHFNMAEDAEISIESNPNDLDTSYLRELRQVGINRLSIGMQSSNLGELTLFARRHDHQAVVTAMQAARDAGFDNINLDLIYGFPNQTMASWQETLNETLLKLKPEHISMYALGLEEGTPMLSWVESGRVPAPDDDLAADMYDYATETLDKFGYEQYEISNWAKPGHACRHNLQYWRNLPYVGLGPGAHGYAAGIRYDTILLPQRYIKAMASNTEVLPFPYTPATNERTQVDWENEIAETLIMSLRLTQEGVNRQEFSERFGIDLVELHGEKLKRFVDYGLLEIQPEVVRITQQGRLLSNTIFRELV